MLHYRGHWTIVLRRMGFIFLWTIKREAQNSSRIPRKYYQTQLDCYCLILDSSGFKTKGIAYLLYFWPLEVLENGMVQFKVEPIRIETDIESAKKIFRDAVTCLGREIPNASSNCEYCNLVSARKAER